MQKKRKKPRTKYCDYVEKMLFAAYPTDRAKVVNIVNLDRGYKRMIGEILREHKKKPDKDTLYKNGAERLLRHLKLMKMK